MSAVLRRAESECGAEVLLIFKCPGCGYGHHARVQSQDSRPVWGWNGSMDRPTFNPSLLVNAHAPGQRCHLFVTDGQLHFLSDCDHHLAGQVVPMLPVED